MQPEQHTESSSTDTEQTETLTARETGVRSPERRTTPPKQVRKKRMAAAQYRDRQRIRESGLNGAHWTELTENDSVFNSDMDD